MKDRINGSVLSTCGFSAWITQVIVALQNQAKFAAFLLYCTISVKWEVSRITHHFKTKWEYDRTALK